MADLVVGRLVRSRQHHPVQFTFNYPITDNLTGHSGKAAKITATGYNATVGESAANWNFTPVTVTPGQLYTFSDHYLSTVATEVDAQYK